jgi:hypothetical protein
MLCLSEEVVNADGHADGQATQTADPLSAGAAITHSPHAETLVSSQADVGRRSGGPRRNTSGSESGRVQARSGRGGGRLRNGWPRAR